MVGGGVLEIIRKFKTHDQTFVPSLRFFSDFFWVA